MTGLEALIQLNRQQLEMNQAGRLERMLAEQEKPISKGRYLGYDSITGLHKAKLMDGSIIQGTFISNGAAPIGAVISVSRSEGGRPLFDTMPR